jgi:hypothetical protein
LATPAASAAGRAPGGRASCHEDVDFLAKHRANRSLRNVKEKQATAYNIITNS